MGQKKRRWPIIVGVLLCLVTLTMAVVLQSEGYLGYLDSDMASEVILGKRQADTHSLMQMDWLYSTEIRILQVNLLYALAFLFTPDFFLARIIGNTLGLALSMGACVFLCRRLRLSWGRSLVTAAMLAAAAGGQYAAYVIVGGYYIVHIGIAFLVASLWMGASASGRKPALAAAGFAVSCMALGFLSVRYVLCVVCPMAAVAGMEMMLTPRQGRSLRDHTMRFSLVTAVGFFACLTGYAASEVLVPRLFISGVGAASSFVFHALDGVVLMQTLCTIFADFLKLLGWRGEAALFSLAGIVNLCIAGTVFLGVLMAVRVYRSMDEREEEQRLQRQMLRLGAAALAVNLFCFLFIKGTYLSRYLILAAIFLLPGLAVVLRREKNMRLRAVLMVLLCVQLGGSSILMIQEAAERSEQAREDGRDMMDTAAFLQGEGYTHGYGTFWNVRVMQERTQGALTFTGVVPVKTEEGAAASVSLDMIRWLEPDDASDLDACPSKTFLLLTQQEAELLTPWLCLVSASKVYGNETFVVYAFPSSQELVGNMLWGKMKLENAAWQNGAYVMQPQGRMRVPTTWRESGDYALRLFCEGTPAQDSVVELYTGSGFALLKRQPMEQGQNEVTFTLEADDKYFMILIKSGQAQALRITDLHIEKR